MEAESQSDRAARYTALIVGELRRRGTILQVSPEKFAFVCPHCNGRGLLDPSAAGWRCLDCTAAGCSESLAVTLRVDPEIRFFEPSELGELAQRGATGADGERAVARIVGHLLRRRVDPIVALELVAAWAQRRCHLERWSAERIVNLAAGRERKRRRVERKSAS